MIELDKIRKLIAGGYNPSRLPASYQAQLKAPASPQSLPATPQRSGGLSGGARSVQDLFPASFAGAGIDDLGINDFLTPEQEAALAGTGISGRNIGMLDRGDLTLSDWLSLVGTRPGGSASSDARLNKLGQLTPEQRAEIEGAVGPSLVQGRMPSPVPGFDPFQGSLLNDQVLPGGMLNIQPFQDIMAQFRPEQYGMLSSGESIPLPSLGAPSMPQSTMPQPTLPETHPFGNQTFTGRGGVTWQSDPQGYRLRDGQRMPNQLRISPFGDVLVGGQYSGYVGPGNQIMSGINPAWNTY